ncbi:I78 family peptidase inhibitor [Bordetella petrii]|uniref:I78 family peptidase inhibitor n=1 Tax=Bordetella petrii TaxID=94624 RepID=UPI00372E4DF0
MIRKLIPLLLVAGLTACATSGTQRAASDAPAADSAAAPSGGSATGPGCDAQPVQDLAGTKYSESVADDARARSHSSHLRVMRPGQVMTMEYNPDRLNLILDGGETITALRCG